MHRNYVFADVNEALPSLLLDLEKHGEEVSSRAGVTKELTHVGITLTKPWRREILLAHRKPNLAAQIAETAWVLAGSNDIGWLDHYLPRAKDFSDDGFTWRAGYGQRLRDWEGRVDQVRWVVEHLRDNPASRQAVMSIWDPEIDTTPGKDIPCNDWLNFSSRLGYLDLHVAVRSNDVIWGWSGINQFEWSALLEIVAGLLGLQVGCLHFSTTSFHIYDRHWTKGRRIVESCSMSAWPFGPIADSPRFNASALRTWDIDGLDHALKNWFEVEKGIRHGENMDSEVDSFPEPMFQSWLRVLQWWWTGDRGYLQPLEGTALELASHVTVQPPERESGTLPAADPKVSDFLASLHALHLEKEAAYGGSWKRRGEMLGIMANIARKVDRLDGGETSDETSADTAGDLFVYLAKYRTWLEDHRDEAALGTSSDHASKANEVMAEVEADRLLQTWPEGNPNQIARMVQYLILKFDSLERAVNRKDPFRYRIVDSMMSEAYVLARVLWEKEQDEYRGADHD